MLISNSTCGRAHVAAVVPQLQATGALERQMRTREENRAKRAVCGMFLFAVRLCEYFFVFENFVISKITHKWYEMNKSGCWIVDTEYWVLKKKKNQAASFVS